MPDNISTSNYWRDLLGLNLPPDETRPSPVISSNPKLRELVYRAFGCLARNIFKTEVSGLENVPEKGPYILACNHLSAFDYPFLVFSLSRQKREQIHAIAKTYLFKNPILKYFTALAVNAFPVDAEEDFLPALKAAAGLLRQNKAIFIAPEGTRSFDGKMMPFRVGVGVLAVELNVPIIPSCLKGTYEVMHRKTYIPHLAKVKVAFGKPMQMGIYQEKKKHEMAYYVYKEATEELRRRMIELQQQLGGP